MTYADMVKKFKVNYDMIISKKRLNTDNYHIKVTNITISSKFKLPLMQFPRCKLPVLFRPFKKGCYQAGLTYRLVYMVDPSERAPKIPLLAFTLTYRGLWYLTPLSTIFQLYHGCLTYILNGNRHIFIPKNVVEDIHEKCSYFNNKNKYMGLPSVNKW